jgi:hypothetical protein
MQLIMFAICIENLLLRRHRTCRQWLQLQVNNGSEGNNKESFEDHQEDILVDDQIDDQQMHDDYRSANKAKLPDPEMRVKEFLDQMERKIE